MQNRPALPEFRSPKAIVHEWRRETARFEVAIAVILMLSICTLLVAITRDVSVASLAAIAHV